VTISAETVGRTHNLTRVTLMPMFMDGQINIITESPEVGELLDLREAAKCNHYTLPLLDIQQNSTWYSAVSNSKLQFVEDWRMARKNTENTEGKYNVPQRCIDYSPTGRTVLFCGKSISLSAVARHAGMSRSAVSMIFSGKREPSLNAAKRIADALNMNFSAFARKLRKHTSSYIQDLDNRRVRERGIFG
jgi:AraC-like DNA-binding protein